MAGCVMTWQSVKERGGKDNMAFLYGKWMILRDGSAVLLQKCVCLEPQPVNLF